MFRLDRGAPSAAPFAATLALLAAMTTACQPSVEPADLVIVGGKVVTVDETLPQAEALAAKDGRILAVGSREQIEAHVGPETEVIELPAEAVAVPGLIEGHGHFLGVGAARMQLDLRDTQRWADVVAMVEEAVAGAEPGAWITGRGWHQDKWDSVPEPSVEGLPIHDTLSAVSPDNPVVLTHASGHASFANAKAMELGGVTSDTADPPGGEIVRDAAGRPTGAMRETAQGLVARRDPTTEAELRQMAELASEECLAKGITSFQDAGTAVPAVETLRTIADEGGLGVRLWMMIRDGNEAIRAALPGIQVTGAADRHFTVGGIKHSIDGALGAHGAWLLAPYSDLPETAGLNTTPIETIEESAEIALESGLQLCVHAIGDRANRETLDLFERAWAGRDDGASLRWRIEHAQHLDLEDLPRFSGMGVIASMQGIHCTSDGPWVPDRLGDERTASGAYLWRSLLDSGAVVTNGTDAPVEDVDPIPNFYATVTRVMNTGEAFYPAEALSRAEALHSMTLAAAYSAFEEDDKGSLTPGKLADVTVLSKDLLTVPDDEILETEVLFTIVGGEVRYRADG